MDTTQTQTQTDAQALAMIDKPAPVAAPQTRVAKPALKYCILQGYRPMSGSALFAHTAAFIELTGMTSKPVARALVARCMGATAVKHHTRSTYFFDETEKGLIVSAIGKAAFALRHIDPELKAGFIAVLTMGKPDARVLKNQLGIRAIDA